MGIDDGGVHLCRNAAEQGDVFKGGGAVIGDRQLASIPTGGQAGSFERPSGGIQYCQQSGAVNCSADIHLNRFFNNIRVLHRDGKRRQLRWIGDIDINMRGSAGGFCIVSGTGNFHCCPALQRHITQGGHPVMGDYELRFCDYIGFPYGGQAVCGEGDIGHELCGQSRTCLGGCTDWYIYDGSPPCLGRIIHGYGKG